MASYRRVAKSSINWTALAERVPPNQRVHLIAFKSKTKIYEHAASAYPRTPPKINWDYYKKLIPIPGMVDSFQKQYDALKVPYPVEKVTSQVERQAKQVKAEIVKYKKSSEARIAEMQCQVDCIKSLLPFDQMTMEEYSCMFPDLALDAINYPTFWPHTPEEQVGYESAEKKAARAAQKY